MLVEGGGQTYTTWWYTGCYFLYLRMPWMSCPVDWVCPLFPNQRLRLKKFLLPREPYARGSPDSACDWVGFLLPKELGQFLKFFVLPLWFFSLNYVLVEGRGQTYTTQNAIFCIFECLAAAGNCWRCNCDCPQPCEQRVRGRFWYAKTNIKQKSAWILLWTRQSAKYKKY